jgi:hypothetical protein
MVGLDLMAFVGRCISLWIWSGSCNTPVLAYGVTSDVR